MNLVRRMIKRYDLLVNIFTKERERIDVNSMQDIGYGWGGYRMESLHLWGGQCYVSPLSEGTLY
jgi:hypothetical protein